MVGNLQQQVGAASAASAASEARVQKEQEKLQSMVVRGALVVHWLCIGCTMCWLCIGCALVVITVGLHSDGTFFLFHCILFCWNDHCGRCMLDDPV